MKIFFFLSFFFLFILQGALISLSSILVILYSDKWNLLLSTCSEFFISVIVFFNTKIFFCFFFIIPISLWILFHAILSSYFTLHTLLPFKHIFLKSFSLKPHIWSFSQAVYAATIFVCVCVCVCVCVWIIISYLFVCLLFFWL